MHDGAFSQSDVPYVLWVCIVSGFVQSGVPWALHGGACSLVYTLVFVGAYSPAGVPWAL